MAHRKRQEHSPQRAAVRLRLALPALVVLAAASGCAQLNRSVLVPKPQPAKEIAILLSEETPAFADVAREIAGRYKGAAEIYRLDADDATATRIQRAIQTSHQSAVVAVGLPAAMLAKSLTGKHVIFCQVFSYEDAGLASVSMKGVAATPPVSELFRYWKSLDPKLGKVGVITGRNLRLLKEEARAAAREHRIDLVHTEVRTDKEMLYAYKRMAPHIQGLWLVPDNRVLSRDVIRDLMAYSVKEGKQVAVFSSELLGLGGLLSAESDPADVAGRVLARLRQARPGGDIPGPAVVPLTKADIQVNAVVAARLGLTLPPELKQAVYAP